jgi:hypothetical protein
MDGVCSMRRNERRNVTGKPRKKLLGRPWRRRNRKGSCNGVFLIHLDQV